MASKAISEDQISKNFLGEHALGPLQLLMHVYIHIGHPRNPWKHTPLKEHNRHIDCTCSDESSEVVGAGSVLDLRPHFLGRG